MRHRNQALMSNNRAAAAADQMLPEEASPPVCASHCLVNPDNNLVVGQDVPAACVTLSGDSLLYYTVEY